MNQKASIQNRWLYRTLRIVSGVMTSLVGLTIILTAITALMGDMELLRDMVEMESDDLKLGLVSQIALVVICSLAVFTFLLLFRSINRFLAHAEKGELFLDSASNALSRMGVSMILLYVVFLGFDVLLPMLIEPESILQNSVDFFIYLIDLNALGLLIGIVLMALAGALREGRALQDELRQIV
ncbi:hypothetical protein [Parasphingorhabdus cellanae]|uniref:DUF2975 domain-containing protein n=1 Tax=Parasphingorhabdus cellanae TaxID=2806553 RepID=A0ABX7T5E9_9SPHN|nr:hypothetical protein [Parasphingorhabdus cellanae]QTD55742.1 hypothetical protein J4G78_16360 [Parasphingorhabdus cellanae]